MNDYNSFNRKKRKLESYIELKYRVESIKNELIDLVKRKDEVTDIQAITYDDMPKGGKQALFSDFIDKLLSKEQILNNSLDRAERRRKEIEEAISHIDDTELRTILRMRYIDDYSDAKIGGLLHSHRTTIWRKCNDGIRLIRF